MGARKFIERLCLVVQDLGRGDLVVLTGCGNVPVKTCLPVKPNELCIRTKERERGGKERKRERKRGGARESPRIWA